MAVKQKVWDWLIVTASNDLQAQAYHSLLKARENSPLLACFKRWQVIADPEGVRVGSGGSTVLCLMEVASKLIKEARHPIDPWEKFEESMSSQRVLIIHAGGDSRRLPAYAPCGKLFVPIPTASEKGNFAADYPFSLFDRLLSSLTQLPAARHGAGQYLVVSGDALLLYDPSEIRFDFPGMTAIGVLRPLSECFKHGVFSVGKDGRVRFYLQKPGLELMESTGALQNSGEGLLDAGLMSFDASFSIKLMRTLNVELSLEDGANWNNRFFSLTMEKGLDFYREICCALGSESNFEYYLQSVRKSGSDWPEPDLKNLYAGLNDLPLYCQTLPWCDFLHFGTTRQLISSARSLLEWSSEAKEEVKQKFIINSWVQNPELVSGERYWIEACQIECSLFLEGENVLTGLTIQKPQKFAHGSCLDISAGTQPDGSVCWFIRPYGIQDSFKDSLKSLGTFCNQPLREWLLKSGIKPEWLWEDFEDEEKCTLWNARLFPAVECPSDYQQWLWYYTPEEACTNSALVERFLSTPRYDCAQMARLVDLEKFHTRRLSLLQAEKVACQTDSLK